MNRKKEETGKRIESFSSLSIFRLLLALKHFTDSKDINACLSHEQYFDKKDTKKIVLITHKVLPHPPPLRFISFVGVFTLNSEVLSQNESDTKGYD